MTRLRALILILGGMVPSIAAAAPVPAPTTILFTDGTHNVNGKKLTVTGATIGGSGNAATLTVGTLTTASVGTAQTIGLKVQNTSVATVGAQQYSPMDCLEGHGWNTTATAASNQVDMCWQLRPVQGATVLPELVLWQSSVAEAGAITPQEVLKIAPTSISTGALWYTLIQNPATHGGVEILSPNSLAGIQIANPADLNSRWFNGSTALTMDGTNIAASGIAAAGALSITKTANQTAAGSYGINMLLNNYRVYIAPASAGADIDGVVAEDFVASGSITLGDVVVWVAGGAKTVATAAATINLTTIAGVALNTVTTGQTVQVVTRGRVLTTCVGATSVTTGALVGTSGATAGAADQTTPGAGAIIGRLAGIKNIALTGLTIGANQCIVYVTL